MIPQSFEQWAHCITHDCKISLTKDFAQQRLKIYQDSNHPETQYFVRLYGNQHLQNIILWFSHI